MNLLCFDTNDSIESAIIPCLKAGVSSLTSHLPKTLAKKIALGVVLLNALFVFESVFLLFA